MNCECEFCKNNQPFEMPKTVIEAAISGNLAIFCGAGISTENSLVLPSTVYSLIKDELKIDDPSISFSKLMQKYCNLPNGRKMLLHKIRKRFEYIQSFPELNENASRFHNELSELYFIRTIITTNWDTYFEDCCGAIPISIPEDIALIDDNDRYVLKIHGSINNLSTIVATEDDYRKCMDGLEKSIIGAKLKTILATMTVVFFGFSFGDEDFNQVINYVQAEMRDVVPHIFIVTLDETLHDRIAYKNTTTIITDGTFFLHKLKLILQEKGLIKNCNSFSHVRQAYFRMQSIHNRTSKISIMKYPCVIFCTAYQDGVMHAFSRYFSLYKSGEYNIPGEIQERARSYSKLVGKRKKEKNYWDAAYFEGYMNGLIFIDLCETEENLIKKFPIYFLPNAKQPLTTFNTLYAELKRVLENPDKYLAFAKKYTTKYKSKAITLHHPPY